MPRVLIVDRHTLFRAALSLVLNDDARVQVVGDARDDQGALAKVVELQPDVVLMDHELPTLDGLQATREIIANHPHIKVLILTSVEGVDSALEALEAGASGFMLKDSELDALVSSIQAVVAGQQVFSGPVISRAMNRSLNPKEFDQGLSKREIEILKMAITGMGNKQIAYRLKISHKTVRNHVSNIYRKLQISDRSEAVLYALREGLVDH